MKRFFIVTLFTVLSAVAFAQDKPRQFDPEMFEEKLETYVVAEAQLTTAESQKFLPLFRELRKKVKEELMKRGEPKFGQNLTDADCEKMIKDHDATEVKIKQLQQKYHEKFLAVLSATKVLKVIGAEEKFMQDAFGAIHARRGDGGRGHGHGSR